MCFFFSHRAWPLSCLKAHDIIILFDVKMALSTYRLQSGGWCYQRIPFQIFFIYLKETKKCPVLFFFNKRTVTSLKRTKLFSDVGRLVLNSMKA